MNQVRGSSGLSNDHQYCSWLGMVSVYVIYNAKVTVSYNTSKEIEFTSSVKLGINYMYMHCIVMNS